ncbi:MAG: DEAD/DEAH box helicase family protein [Myxococcales bacterium]|nr:DEAD/DEAH box helicase family protein [Myxococcales bacterium]
MATKVEAEATCARTPAVIRLRFAQGTLELHGLEKDDPEAPPEARWDPRSGCYRAEAIDYARLVMRFRRDKREYADDARAYAELADGLRVRRDPRPYQSEALDAWWKARGRGVVVLPTGAGKSHVAMMAIDRARRSTLVVAPTLDLVRQWYDGLRTSFGVPVGVVGGGEHRVEDITVTTYDSAYIHMEHLGARFGLAVYDEAHHLPSETYALAARLAIAPFRLGLTATPERQDGRESILDDIVGPIVYRKEIVAMSGDYLADYDTERVEVELSPEERERYEEARAVYRAFVTQQGIRLGTPQGFADFIARTARSEEGRRAMAAYREQRQLAFCAPAKLEYLEHLLDQHRDDRAILFTQDNATCYAISRRFLVPAITHQTKIGERSHVLEGLASGHYRAVVTSKVLNEGVDVPDANVAIVVSGSGSVREHVQRLGRVLRKKGDKRAILYELVTARTGEAFTSERRRDHVAYR